MTNIWFFISFRFDFRINIEVCVFDSFDLFYICIDNGNGRFSVFILISVVAKEKILTSIIRTVYKCCIASADEKCCLIQCSKRSSRRSTEEFELS